MLHAAHVTTANVSDKAGAKTLVASHQEELQQVEKVLVDGGHIGQPFADAIQESIHAEVEVVKRSELHSFKVIPKRWVVERSLSWLEKCRRLWKNCERHLETSLQMVILAFVALLLKRF